MPEITQIRAIVDDVDSKQFSPVFKEVLSRLQEEELLEQYQILSGLNGASGDVSEGAIIANETAFLGLPKMGFF